MDYQIKYLKYKQKYLQLKGGTDIIEININFNPYKEFILKLINNLNYEVAFSIDVINDKIITEFFKGLSDMTRSNIFNKEPTFGYIICHTHFNSKLFEFRFSPPSSNDYNKLIVSHFKHFTDYEIVFTNEGIYVISLGEKLLNIINNNPKLSEVAFYHLPDSRDYNDYYGTDEWINFLDEIADKTNDAHIVLSSNDFYNHISQDGSIKKIEIDKVIATAIEYGNEVSRTLEGYLEIIKNIGFNIIFYKWTDSLDLQLKIKKSNYIPIRQNNDNIILHTESNLFNLKSINLDLLYDKLIELNEGDVLHI